VIDSGTSDSLNPRDSSRDYRRVIHSKDASALAPGSLKDRQMANITNGYKWAVGAAMSICFAVVGSAQARVLILDDPYNPGEQVVVEIKGCPVGEAGLEKLLPVFKQRQTTGTSTAAPAPPAAVAPSVRIAMASPVRAARLSLPLVLGVGY
jgi:hypothetical protein